MSQTPAKPPAPKTGPAVAETDAAHHEEHGSKKKLPHKMPDLNIVPMLDVCFNLLIFFIMVAQFSVGEGILPAELPRGDSGKAVADLKPAEAPLIIGLVSDGGEGVAIDIPGATDAPANFEELFKRIKSMQSPGNPQGMFTTDSPVIIRPDDNVPWSHIVDAFNAAVRARYVNINFGQPVK